MREELDLPRVPVAGPSITDRELAYVSDAVRNGWYGGAGEYERRFERAFADHVGVRHAVSLPSCTSAIHLSLLAHGIGVGDEVIVPDATWIATAAPVTYVGAETVFADVDPVTWCLDVAAFEAAITPRTRAVIPVDLYGGMPDLASIRRIADAHGILVIEDAAEAVGSQLRGQPAGSFGHTGVFSFHGSKTLTTGEGGMLVTDSDEVLGRVSVLRDHGRQPGDTMFRNDEVGWKYKMSGLQAALGLAQLERLSELVGMKRRIFSWYEDELGDHPAITLNAEPDAVRNSYWMVTVIIDADTGVAKEDVVRGLSAQGIDTRPFFYPLSSLGAYAGTASSIGASERNPVSYELGAYGVNLPSALSLERDDVVRVAEALRRLPGLA
jgi:perosamine synthetase